MEQAKVVGANYLFQQARQLSPTTKVSEFGNWGSADPSQTATIGTVGRNDHPPARHAARAVEAGCRGIEQQAALGLAISPCIGSLTNSFARRGGVTFMHG